MSNIHALAKSLTAPTIDEILAAIAADLAFMEGEFRSAEHKLSMSDAMPGLIRAMAKKLFTGDEADIIDATFAVIDHGRRFDPDDDDTRYISAVEDYRSVSGAFLDRRVDLLAEQGFEV